MNTGSKTRMKNAVKGTLLFTVLSLFPVAVLLAGPGPLTQDHIQFQKRQEVVKEWKGMKLQVNSILKKADQLKNYRAIN
ncbi:MAG: hypothetical protein VXV96_04010 [Bdellovibrionota bacterium]|jgi:hypothetical protein|nr:hypothetical protein [Bdellovibrionota bacterium]